MLGLGHPKVKLTQPTRSAATISTLSSKASSSQRASPRATPRRSDTGWITWAYRLTMPGSAGVDGQKILTPNGAPLSARVAEISSLSRAGDR